MFGDILQELRLDFGLTQEELAQKFNITRTTLSKYETNENEPNFEFLIKVSNYFDVSIDYLLGKTKIPTPQNTLYEISKNLSSDSFKKLHKILLKFRSDEMYIDFVYTVLSAVNKIKK